MSKGLVSARIREVKPALRTLSGVVGVLLIGNALLISNPSFIDIPDTTYKTFSQNLKSLSTRDREIEGIITQKLNKQMDIDMYKKMILEETSRQKELEVERKHTTAILRYCRYLETVAEDLNIELTTRIDTALNELEEERLKDAPVPNEDGEGPETSEEDKSDIDDTGVNMLPNNDLLQDKKTDSQYVTVIAEGTFGDIIQFSKRLETSELYFIYDFRMDSTLSGNTKLQFSAKFEEGS